jgi:hypothetical protein
MTRGRRTPDTPNLTLPRTIPDCPVPSGRIILPETSHQTLPPNHLTTQPIPSVCIHKACLQGWQEHTVAHLPGGMRGCLSLITLNLCPAKRTLSARQQCSSLPGPSRKFAHSIHCKQTRVCACSVKTCEPSTTSADCHTQSPSSGGLPRCRGTDSSCVPANTAECHAHPTPPPESSYGSVT